ncbi:MAG: tetratricopeptide repeat protein [Planctomycetes bacterium]|nr:tetratricopeptide repeat protein [Planctomycetota bacterium]
MSDAEYEDAEEKLQELNQEITDLGEQCLYRTMMRVAHEARRLARVEQLLIPYLTASFHVMNDSRNILQPVAGREVSIELITLLESEERARQFQPNLPEDEYERTKWWLTACSYDNLAVHTSAVHGYNSDGMHQCISDGIQVCRRTGKTQCISCFREYATEVYMASDDMDMALHHARVGITHKDPGPHDRRHAGAKDNARILLMQGHVDAALEALELAWKLTDVYHSPYAGKLNTYTMAVEMYHLAGCPERLESLPRRLSAEEGERHDGSDDEVLIEPPRDEYPSYFLDRDSADAFVACCQGDYDTAIALLQPWDALLREQNCLNRWFEVRLRLVAIARMTGKMSRAQALAKPLQESAQQARDWLVLRRLQRLLEESIPATPLALAGPVTVGPFADKAAAEPAEQPAETNAAGAADAESEDESGPVTPLGEKIGAFYGRLMQSGGEEEELAALIRDIVAISPASISDPVDAGRVLHVIRFAVQDAGPTTEIYRWAEAIAQHHPQDATVLSMFAALAAHLRDCAEGDLDEVILDEKLESLFRQSLDLDPNAGDNFARAGSYYLDQENYGEAERCLARGFRLMRSSSHLALRLASVYSRTGRPRDAVAVLDMALREGCEDPDVAWEAALSANHVEQYEAVITYLDRFDELNPQQPWSNYYRASALLELNRPEEAMVALNREAEYNPEMTYHVAVQRASCLAALKQVDELHEQLRNVLSLPLSEVTYLTANGMQKLFTQLWKSVDACLAPGDPSLQSLETRLLETGLAPNEMFAAHRERATATNDDTEIKSNFYRCIVRQPLDDRWLSFSGRLQGEEDWTAYDIPWGVLAANETEAGELVMDWQARCFPLPAEILAVEEDGTDFSDVAGVVWQGYRDGVFPDDDDEDDDDLDEDSDS